MGKKRLNFGCGNKIKEGWINVDIQKGKKIDKSFDFYDKRYPFDDNEFDEILIDNVLEHLNNPSEVMRKLWRISKPNAMIRIVVPYYNSYWAYADVTHVNFFNEVAIEQMLGDVRYVSKKQVEKFEIVELRSVPQKFLSFLPRTILNVLKRFLGNVITSLDVEVRVVK